MKTVLGVLVVFSIVSLPSTSSFADCGDNNEECLIGRPGDMDLDGDVDGTDFLLLAACLYGPAHENMPPDCSIADLDYDTDVDLRDYAHFQNEYSGTCNCGPNLTAPASRIDVQPFLGEAPLTVSFSGSRSWDAEAVIRSYEWTFSDGGSVSGEEASYTFTTPGNHTATLTVTDAGGLSSQTDFVITVSDGSYHVNDPVMESEARRFLWQAGFGPDTSAINFIVANGYEAWIDAQFLTQPTLLLREYLDYNNSTYGGTHPGYIWDDLCVAAPDPLRQRMAWALIQIIVSNNQQNNMGDAGNAHYYSQYIDLAFGNYRDLLEYVTFSHHMGIYLTYMGNLKENPDTGSSPDENYARELLQLFTIGMWELNPDGTRKLDLENKPIPTYDNSDIRQYARIFTGLDWNNTVDWRDAYLYPMRMYEYNHEFGSKQLLSYPGAIPSGGFIPEVTDPSQQTVATAEQDIQNTIDNAFMHPNCAPFISRQLIQRFVTSNPTPGYIERVATAFEGGGPYGSGQRGDLAATIKAILLDNEARDPAYRMNPLYGVVKEPIVVRWSLYKILERVDRPDETFPHRIATSPWNTMSDFGQTWMGSPSVFNFYPPDYIPPGTEIAMFNRYAPELAIYNDVTTMGMAERIRGELVIVSGDNESRRYDDWRLVASNPTSLVNTLNTELMFGTLSTEFQQLIVTALEQIDDNTERVRSAVWLIANSPEFRILR